jgi:PAS domain S-box-containing protein
MNKRAPIKSSRRSTDRSKLRRRAESRLRRHQTRPDPTRPEADPTRMLHELEVHQIELELQNAELRKTRDELEAALENYTDLYDFAPVGYFTLAASGTINQVNLTGANLVDIERSRLVGQQFELLLPGELRPAFNAFLNQVFLNPARCSRDFAILRPGQPPRIVNIEAQRLLSRQECRAAVVDITQRNRAEETVRVSEIRYRRLFETAHDGVLLLDPVTRKITDANPFMTQLLGYSHDQLVGKELFEIGLLKDESASRTMFQALKKSHGVRYENLPLESREGRHQEVEVVANLYQENGRSVIQCNIRDITERKQTELALIRLASIVESSDDAIIGLELTGRVHSWNTGAQKIFGYSAREMLGTSMLRLIPAKRRNEEQKILAQIKRGRSVQHFETLRQTKTGRVINVSITASPIKDARGRIIGVSKVARDITARKQAEEILRRNEALFSALVAQAPVGVYVVDAAFRLQQLNPTAQVVFKKVHPLIGRDFSEIIRIVWPDRVANQIVKRFRHTLQTGQSFQSPEFTARRRDLGVSETYEWQIQRVTLPAGELGVVCFFSNLTARKHAEDAQRRLDVLSASNQKLEQEIVRRRTVEESLRKSEQHQRRLLAQSHQMQEKLRQLSRKVLWAQEEERKRISRELHDVIAQTLTGINVRLATLKRGVGVNTKDFDRHLAQTQKLVEKSVDIVHQFARELRPAVLDDLGLIPALHSFLKNFTAQTGIRTHLTAFAGIEQLEITKRTVLFRVAQEALTNVARHAQVSRVEVSIQKLAAGICLKVKDAGRAFDVEHALRINRGKRLGLLGMRERLEMVGGQFEIVSAPGHGTTVTAQIPFGKFRARGGGGAGVH